MQSTKRDREREKRDGGESQEIFKKIVQNQI